MSLVRIVAAGDTHIGRREHNEDAILLRRELNLFALADGAGGENAGNVASSLALTTLGHRFEATEEDEREGFDVLGLPMAAKRLSAAIHRANAEVVQLAAASDKYQGMGTTVVAAYVEPQKAVLHLAHVGDSRCYRLRAGIVELLTQDHSLMNDVLELAPELDEEKAKTLPTRVVTRALGMSKSVRVAMHSFALAPGDRYLMCSDGLTDQLEEEQIADALGQDVRPDALVKILLDIAHAPQARDNIAVLVLDVHPTGATDWPSPTLRARPLQQQVASAIDDDDEPELLIVERDDEDDGFDEELDEELDEDDEAELIVEDGDVEVVEDPPTAEFKAVKLVPTPSPEKAAAIKKVLRHMPDPKEEREATIRFQRSCRHCDAQFDGPADVCPFCWKAV
ncbi:MAG: protein phosphatase 2C domain-containing protein [Myxococcota bacterium]